MWNRNQRRSLHALWRDLFEEHWCVDCNSRIRQNVLPPSNHFTSFHVNFTSFHITCKTLYIYIYTYIYIYIHIYIYIRSTSVSSPRVIFAGPSMWSRSLPNQIDHSEERMQPLLARHHHTFGDRLSMAFFGIWCTDHIYIYNMSSRLRHDIFNIRHHTTS